jgi:hypothetical protein
MKSMKLLLFVIPALIAVSAGVETHGRWSAGRLTADTAGGSGGDPRAAIFLHRGCPECHAISALGVKAMTDAGPDLTFAYADVGSRYGMSLQSFFDDTPGLMRLVLTSHLHLTKADRDSITRILHDVYQEHLADMDREVPSFPPGRARPRSRPDSVPVSYE